MTESSLDISVIVPTYNRREIVSRSLETLFRQDFPSSQFEIIVVVDGSTDGTADALRAMRAPCLLRVLEQENRGAGAARNAGCRAASSKLVLFLDDDMRCHSGLVAAHVEAHQRLGDVAVFGALFLAPDSKKNLAAECFNREIGAFHLRRLRDPILQWQLTECVFSNSSLPRQLLADAGGFDEQFRVREDLELGIRLIAMGVKTAYVSDAIAYQYYDKTASDLLLDAQQFGVADALLARKHSGETIAGQLKWLEREPAWKKRLRWLAVRFPFVENCLLAPWCILGDAFFEVLPLRTAGVRALQMRRRIRWLRAVCGVSSS